MNQPTSSNAPVIVEKELSYKIIGGFYETYNDLGYGFVETLYARRLFTVLTRQGLMVQREYPVPVICDGEQIGFHRLDMLVNERIIVEIKSTETLAPFAWRQLQNYLKATGLELGILLHFGPKASYKRILNPKNKNFFSPSSGS